MLGGWPIEIATSRQPTSAKITESGRAPEAKFAPTMIEKATAAAGAMCVTDWNTSRRPIASRLRPGSAGAVVVVVVPGAFGAEPSIASLPYGEPNFDYPLGEVHSRKGLAQIAGSDDRAGVSGFGRTVGSIGSLASASRGEDERCTGRWRG